MTPPPQQTEQDQRTAEARTAFTASLSSVGSSMDADLRSRATVLHSNSAALAKQEADLAKETAALTKQAAQWQKMADNSQQKLKEIGDVQNWAEMIERDLLVIEETLRTVEDEDTNHARRHISTKDICQTLDDKKQETDQHPDFVSQAVEVVQDQVSSPSGTKNAALNVGERCDLVELLTVGAFSVTNALLYVGA